jgi:WD40 repeat protein
MRVLACAAAAGILAAILPAAGAGIAAPASPGEQLWASRYNGPRGAKDVAEAIAANPDGSNVYVTGHSRGASSDDYATVAYDAATGAQLWVSLYEPGLSAAAIAVDRDGSKVFVTGTYATIAYDAITGGQLWIRESEPALDGAAIAVSAEGSTVYATGASAGSFLTAAYDAATGAELWTQRYSGRGASDNQARSLGVSPDGSKLFVSGRSYNGSNWDYATVGYDTSDGTELWSRRYDGPASGDDNVSGLEVSPDGAMVFVTGSSTGSGTGSDYATIAYDASTGARLWLKRYDGPANGTDAANAVGVSPDGSMLFVTGGSGVEPVDYATVAYQAATGRRLWVGRYYWGEATALGVTPEGTKLFVTGTAGGPQDYATIGLRRCHRRATLGEPLHAR